MAVSHTQAKEQAIKVRFAASMEGDAAPKWHSSSEQRQANRTPSLTAGLDKRSPHSAAGDQNGCKRRWLCCKASVRRLLLSAAVSSQRPPQCVVSAKFKWSISPLPPLPFWGYGDAEQILWALTACIYASIGFPLLDGWSLSLSLIYMYIHTPAYLGL